MGKRPTGKRSPRTGQCTGTSSWKPRGDIADVFLFEVLKECVDPATQTILKALRQKSPELTFEKAWHHLERTNAYDPVGARRKECRGRVGIH